MQAIAQPNQGFKTGSAGIVLALVMVLLLAVSSSWGACYQGQEQYVNISPCYPFADRCDCFKPGGHKYSETDHCWRSVSSWSSCTPVEITYKPSPSRCFQDFVYCTDGSSPDSLIHEIVCKDNPSAPGCVNQDSLDCFSRGGSWQNGKCIETSYHCQNAGGTTPYGGSAPQAIIYKCENEVCVEQQRLSGTCSDWGYCDGAQNCDITDSTGKVPCTRSGNGTSTNGKCYYQCGNGKSYTCSSKYSTWAGGSVYIGTCPDYPECATDINKDTTNKENPYNDGGSVSDSVVHRDTSSWGDPGTEPHQIDYYPILDSILDTLTLILRNAKSQTFSQQSIDETLKGVLSNDLDQIVNYNKQEFNLVGEVSKDLDSSRALLEDIKDLMSDTLNVRFSGGSLDSSSLASDSSWGEKIFNWFKGAFGSTADSSRVDCDALLREANKCIAMGGNAFQCRLNWVESCSKDISPVETMVEGVSSVLSRILDCMAGSDSVNVDTSAVVDSSVYDRVRELLSRYDSIPEFNLDSLKSSLQERLDSASRVDTVSMNTDSLFTDTASIKERFKGSGIFLPGGTNSTCYVCRAELGTLGGLSDTSLVIEVDFGDFGGYDWCELIRTVVRIATLVVVISLTLGSFAAAFGWNKNTGE